MSLAGQCCFLGFPGKFSVEARSYALHRASVFLRLGIFENTLCQLEHLSSEMKIVGIAADQSGTNHTVKADSGQREGPGPLSHCTWTVAFCVYFQVNRKDPGSTSVIIEKGLKQNKMKLPKAYVYITLSGAQESILLCDCFKGDWVMP